MKKRSWRAKKGKEFALTFAYVIRCNHSILHHCTWAETSTGCLLAPVSTRPVTTPVDDAYRFRLNSPFDDSEYASFSRFEHCGGLRVAVEEECFTRVSRNPGWRPAFRTACRSSARGVRRTCEATRTTPGDDTLCVTTGCKSAARTRTRTRIDYCSSALSSAPSALITALPGARAANA